MDYAVCWHFIVPIASFRNILPFFNRTFVCNVFEAATFIKHILTDRSHAVPDCYACDTAAISHRRRTDRRHAVPDCCAC